MMKPRELGGAIRSAKVCYVWVFLSEDDGQFIQVSKTEARQLVEAAKDYELEEMLGFVKDGEVFLGDDDDGTEIADGGEMEEEEDGVEEEDAEEEDGEEEAEEENPPPAVAAPKKKQ